MNANQENKISMYHKVRTFFAEHETTLSPSIPILSNRVSLFNDKLTELLQFEMQATEVNTGYTVEKQNSRNALTESALTVSGAASAYAIDMKVDNMLDKVYYTRSTLDAFRDSDFIVKLEDLYFLCKPTVIDLEPYGATASEVNAFFSLLNHYHELYQNPAHQRSEGRSYGVAVETSINEIDNILALIDALMATVSITHTILYNNYKYDRMIDDMGTGSSTPPDIVVAIAPLSIQNVYTIQYLTSRSFKVKNLSNEPLKWCLSTSETSFSTPPHDLFPKSTSDKLSGTLAPEGDFLLFQNETANPVNIEITISE